MHTFNLDAKINVLSARVAQWLERRAQRSDDPCVGGSNPTGTWVPVYRMRPYNPRPRVAR
jgi:hypothetical protein